MAERGGSLAERACWPLAALTLAACLLFPISSADLWWHLSAARRLIETGRIPDHDWLSFTRQGAPWTNFEWGAQLVFWAVHAAAGLAGLWLFKAGMLAASAAALWKTLGLYALPRPMAAAAMALWAAASLTRSDIRPELFSTVAFSLLFYGLEAKRLGRRSPAAAWLLPFFSLWANLHPGYVMGLILVAFYATTDRRLWPAVAWAGAGTLLQPLGPRAYHVLLAHGRDMETISRHLLEWAGITLSNPWHWPYWATLLALAAAALRAVRRKTPLPTAPLAAAFLFAFAASRHSRLSGYFIAVAIPLAARLSGAVEAGVESAKDRASGDPAGTAGVRASQPPSAKTLAAGAAACLAFSLWCGRSFGLGSKVFNPRSAPEEAARFLQQEASALSGLRLYHPWAWGGYLGYWLHPAYPVFQDGRYIFHDLLEEQAQAMESPASWQAFLDRRRIGVAALENRPWMSQFMPEKRWALIHRDPKALVFVRRSAAPPSRY